MNCRLDFQSSISMCGINIFATLVGLVLLRLLVSGNLFCLSFVFKNIMIFDYKEYFVNFFIILILEIYIFNDLAYKYNLKYHRIT